MGSPPASEKQSGLMGPADDSSNQGEATSHEVFKITKDGVNFRTVSWPQATIIFLKSKTSLFSHYFAH
ncbi:hypothetical protein jhhlp_004804 [Lomentospora prolificans]|uniref:Uncharacterized protein n=1 Tax=Lomentospora prolificans TaxID=41688 RepID=A0A2N3N8H0_9PEZI|nr:hypothetical protein jhhlp_004804 [Lomentospora prolificans]